MGSRHSCQSTHEANIVAASLDGPFPYCFESEREREVFSPLEIIAVPPSVVLANQKLSRLEL